MLITSSNVEINNPCDDCIHKNVCKYSEDFTRMSNEIRLRLPNGNFDMTLEMNCKNYTPQNKVLICRDDS